MSDILVAAESADEAAAVLHALHADELPAQACHEAGQLAATFDRLRPAVLVLAFKSLAAAESQYLSLYRHSAAAASLPHRTVLLCGKDDVRRAYDLCRQGCFDDYVLFWPLAQDGLRLPMSIRLALRSVRDAAPAAVPDVAGHATRIGELADTVERQLEAGRERLRQTQQAGQEAGRALARTVQDFGRHLLDEGLEDAVKVQDAPRAAQALERLATQAVAPAVQALNSAPQPLRQWVEDLDADVAAPLRATGDALARAARRRRRLLVVDDDAFLQRMLRRLIQGSGHEVRMASDATQALHLLAQDVPDLILMDVELGTDSGIELLHRIRRDPAYRAVPVLMLTGHRERSTLVDSLAAGASDFVVKPFDRDTLLRKVGRLLGDPLLAGG